MRDFAMFIAMFALLPLAFKNAFNAYLLWGWTAMLSPVFYMFGFMQGLRYNLIFAGITLVLLVFGKLDLKGKLSSNSTTVLFLLFVVHVTMSNLIGYGDNSWKWTTYEDFFKVAIFAVLLPVFVTTRLRLHAFVLIICLALGFHGVVEGLKMIASGGGHKVRGLTSTMLSDNNHFAVGMCMVMPLLVYLMTHMQNRLVSYAAIGGIGLTVLSVIGTNSRGGFLCIAVLAIWYALTSRRKVLASAIVILVGFIALQLAPDSWFQRIDSIGTASEDDSFLGRVVAWKVSTAVAMANPFFGGGMRAIQAAPVWQEFMYRIDFLSFIWTPPPLPFARAAHSIYFEVLGDLGLVGLALFLAMIANAFLTARKIRLMVANRPDLIWAQDLSDALRLGLVAYCVGGAGVSLAYLDLFYMTILLLEVVRQRVAAEIQQTGMGAHSRKEATLLAGAA